MKPFLFFVVLVAIAASGGTLSRGEEAHVSVYVVDHSTEFAAMGGACLPYTPTEKTGNERELLCVGKGPAGSTLLMMAFDRDLPYLDLAPVLAPQTADSEPLRFPAEGTTWPYDKPGPAVDLYVAVFLNDDPALARIAEYVEWLGESLKQGDKETAMLHALAIKNRLSNILRQRKVDDYRVTFGSSLADSIRDAPASKAAVTRSGKSALLTDTTEEPKSPVAAVRRGLKKLNEQWRDDARVISFGLATPGVLVFPITTPVAP